MKLLKLIYIELKNQYILIKKYKHYFFITMLLLPIVDFINNFFFSKFAGLVNVYGHLINYLLFLYIGMAITFTWVRGWSSFCAYPQFPIKDIYVFKGLEYLAFVNAFKELVEYGIRTVIVSFLVCVVTGFSFTTFLLIYFISFVLMLPATYVIIYLLYTLKIFLRGQDYVSFHHVFNESIYIIMPIHYTLQATGNLAPIFYLFPTSALLEGVRLVCLGIINNFSLGLLIYGFISCILLALILRKIFYLCFEYGRKTGQVMLQ